MWQDKLKEIIYSNCIAFSFCSGILIYKLGKVTKAQNLAFCAPPLLPPGHGLATGWPRSQAERLSIRHATVSSSSPNRCQMDPNDSGNLNMLQV